MLSRLRRPGFWQCAVTARASADKGTARRRAESAGIAVHAGDAVAFGSFLSPPHARM